MLLLESFGESVEVLVNLSLNYNKISLYCPVNFSVSGGDLKLPVLPQVAELAVQPDRRGRLF